ncbi:MULTISPECIES: 23S rRNA (guanine(745)-N(1))-methyltransferase [Xenorhabdus]|uniref:23S rRNA (guanine(745)-N(1))-methyltransferase n=1 Tax=Xenorhabdus TaxID=626 RepID=UPI00064B6979|nr:MULTISPECIES: 23S rRNA (guanine(745)-N(1))-methyltransferase [Xenorhabdus]KLU16322.1 23S rRNA methyltransferase [Xenorhabdus griffiniae]KOP32394.1 23S rRNA methyltransferase [Xenorhabdus sp. GDc328]
MSYQCPLCHSSLLFANHQWRCENNHQFDCAKEGYVNLLPVQHKRSKEPGDSVEMMQARRAFLHSGHYQALQQKTVELLGEYLPESAETLLDIGCGEGYYTAAVQEQLNPHRKLAVYGLDVAKIAVRYGARRYPDVHFCVASSHRLPFANHSLDGILRIYAPCKATELARVVKTGGIVLTVTPGPRHLYQLKALIYQEVHLHPENQEQWEEFELISTETLAYTMSLNGEQAHNLLQMTPFAWRASDEVKRDLIAREQLNCEADFTLKVYRRI